MNFFPLLVKEIKKLTHNSVEIIFEIPQELKLNFGFKAGQYIVLEINGERRSYSICSSPLDPNISIGVKAIENGLVSNYLVNQLQVGDVLSVSEPQGRFVIPSKPNEKRTLLAFASGSGITPILSQIKFTLQTEEFVQFHLFFGNKTPQETMFLAELKELQKQYPENLFLHLLYSQETADYWLYNGRLNQEKFELILNQVIDIDEVDEVMICGPNEMVKEIAKATLENGIPQLYIHFELFTTEESAESFLPLNEIPDQAEISVKFHGKDWKTTWHIGENLIDTMWDAGANVPYSCKGGVCSSCVCKLVEGEVVMEENYILTESEINNGWILACISLPKTSEIKLSYDEPDVPF